jgi:hypothetical protein
MTLDNLEVGSHRIKALYSGNENFKPSTAPLDQQVNKINTITTVTSSANPSTLGERMDFIATVSAVKGLPTGTVQFVVDGKNVGNPKNLNKNGQASMTLDNLEEGSHRITALYSGNENFNGSNSSDFIATIKSPEKKSEENNGKNISK